MLARLTRVHQMRVLEMPRRLPTLRWASALLLAATVAAALVACAPGATNDLARAGAARTSATVAPPSGLGPLSGTGSPASLKPRPEEAPDLVIIAISGHCGLICDTRSTWSYLDHASENTGGVAVLDGIRKAYERLGFGAIEVFAASSFVTSHYSSISKRIEPGYLQVQAYLDEVKANWIDGIANPTRVVLVGHSHGTVWASLLAINNLDVTFDAFVALDAICWMWWNKHRGYVEETYLNGPWAIPFPLDHGDPCGTLEVPGQPHRMNINDVVPANVIYGLEVRTSFRLLSLDPNVLADDNVNVRINGTYSNTWGITATESHADLGKHFNRSVGWVSAMLEALGVPDHADFPMSSFVLPPPPAGFEYSGGDLTPTDP